MCDLCVDAVAVTWVGHRLDVCTEKQEIVCEWTNNQFALYRKFVCICAYKLKTHD